jgi:hypothetical protein
MDSNRPQHPGVAPNFTTAFLVSFGLLVFMALFTIWVIFGLIIAGLVSWLADRIMTVDFRNRPGRS